MLALIQRVDSASVSIEGKDKSKIDHGLLVLLGAVVDDDENKAELLAEKIASLRIFEDDSGKMNLSIKDVGGSVLVVSQFTLAANCKKGRRPSFDNAMEPGQAKELYELFAELLKEQELTVKKGEFAAHMKVSLVNDGPVTIWLDTNTL